MYRLGKYTALFATFLVATFLAVTVLSACGPRGHEPVHDGEGGRMA